MSTHATVTWLEENGGILSAVGVRSNGFATQYGVGSVLPSGYNTQTKVNRLAESVTQMGDFRWLPGEDDEFNPFIREAHHRSDREPGTLHGSVRLTDEQAEEFQAVPYNLADRISRLVDEWKAGVYLYYWDGSGWRGWYRDKFWEELDLPDGS